MYHTDYSNKLRKANRKCAKNVSRTETFSPTIEDRTTHLHRAVVAAVLVIVAILQMDPANAEPTMDVAGYGTLQLVNSNQPIRATVVSNNLDMVIENDQLGLSVEQTFINQTSQHRHGRYWLALPGRANIISWQAKFESCNALHYSLELKCEGNTQPVDSDADFLLARMKNRLLIKTPALSPNQQVSIRLRIAYPDSSSVFSNEILNSPAVNDRDRNAMPSVAAAAGAIGSVSIAYPMGILRSDWHTDWH